jgi:hypothetical protein
MCGGVSEFIAESGTQYLVAWVNGTLKAYDSSGVQVATQVTASTSAYCTFATLSTSTRAALFCQPGGILPYYFAEVVGVPTFTQQIVTGRTPNGRSVAVTPWDQRLVNGPIGGGSTELLFSDPGDPSVWGTNNFIDLNEGAGGITAIVVWRDLLFVFKQSRYFVFYSTGLATDGSPIFNYRTVAAQVGTYGYRAAVAAPDGVYFMHSSGVYRTTGGPPEKVSRPIDPIFMANLPAPYFTGGRVNQSQTYLANAHMGYANGQVYCAYTATGDTVNKQALVYNVAAGAWSYWSTQIVAMCTWASATYGEALMFANPSSTYRIQLISGASTTDNGTSIAASYRWGFWNPGQPSAESVVREWLLDGAGTVNVKTAVNDTSTLGSSASVTLGTAPAIVQGRDRRAVRGRNVSAEISGTAPWTVSRVTANLRGQRNAGLKAT